MLKFLRDVETTEIWSPIQGFSNYEISNFGNVMNLRTGRLMRTSLNNHGHVKINLLYDIPDNSGQYPRLTRSVAQLVAEAFVRPPSPLCDAVVVLDGNFTNLSASNLVWRTPRFAWKYTRQLKERQPIYYRNLPIVDVTTDKVYNSIVEAGIKEGLLFEDIWNSTWSGNNVYPTGAIFRVIK